ncbi:nitrite reductase large subunit NirB [Paraferrimonas sp. SM1919]|uniref:nitrite reductase large subunit NirB n=1 Tax=Paraferrimonas sp. SM1919 TaxID=2662263 RepID=UPI0013D2CA11|nr:nitrite reductase large subunit NirB [Paraferrimonas sp. SM1919]
MNKSKVLVIGNGMVGHRFIEDLCLLDSDKQFQITTFAEEPRLAYDRVQLSSYFTGNSADDLALTTAANYQQQQVSFLVNNKVIQINPTAKSITTANGQCYEYDKLVLATGSYPFVPPIPGNDGEHCHVYRTIEDLEAIKSSAHVSKSGVVIGGGLLGLEAANALKQLGLETHVIEFAPKLMAVQLDDGGASLLRRKIEKLGVQVHTSKATTEIISGEQHRYRLNFSDGSFVETDTIVFSAGIRPQDDLAKACGLTLGERGGIVINQHCQTSHPDIYAIGECALFDNKIFGLVAPGYDMANVAANHLLGQPKSFNGADMSTKLKLLGVDVASIGDAHGNTPGSMTFSYDDGVEQIYQKLVVSEDGRKLLGAVLVGDTSKYGNLLQMMLNDMDLPENPGTLITPSANGDEAMGVDALPDSAQICSCYNVSKGDIAQAVSAGHCDMAAIKASTKASSGCGGCAALTKQVLDAELANLGMEVNTDICEHFAYSRVELADIVRVKKIKTFDALLDEYGSGLGCDICKPAVGSILASFWNDYILEQEHIGLQDTNDIYLGNMQKDGSYSVVPRVPAGEITPDKLIVLGQVAKDYDLYTKITGGQRVDLFGAQLHELPQIWRRLIDAGFETGHAYGKSLRTVKSCVGDSWCRYGVQDSMTMAIDLENRYKGLRSPHKLKFAVSGCTRECAEAQSKDIGVIATEAGWNLYVAGNGGMRPRHAELFASDIDTDTLIKYIDRILIFYVRTADRLQRTSVWMENLEGGLDYLKSVIIDDKLGLNDELEQQMQHVIGTYQCEWKTTIESPQMLKRFNHFINSDASDSSLNYTRERGQKRPSRQHEIKILEIN